MAAILLSAAAAQDTIHTTMPLDNYFYNDWPSHQLGDTMICDYYRVYDYELYEGIARTSNDKITIYGFAFGVSLKYNSPCFNDWVYDTLTHGYRGINPHGYYDSNGMWHMTGDSALDESYMDFYIVQFLDGQGYPVGDTVRLHMKYDTVAYYLDQEFSDIDFWRSCPPFSVYEKYFKEPPMVTGLFFLGGVNHSAKLCERHGLPLYPTIRSRIWGKLGDNLYDINVSQTVDGEFRVHGDNLWQWFFPILTPCPDTNYYQPDDSTQTSTLTTTWERYVSLQPNPASDEAMVLSSFGIDEVEVFDMAGSRVLRQEASGLSAKLDVKALPRGSYIVRIHTPMGITSRKLVVQ